MSDDLLELRARIADARQAIDDAKRLASGVHDVGDESEEAGRKAEGSARGFALLGDGLKSLIGYVGLGGVAFGIKDVVEAGALLQKQQLNLRSAMKQVGITGEEAYEKVEKAAVQSSEHGGFSRDTEFQSITNYIRLTKNSTDALNANRAAVELSRGAGINWQSAQRYIGQALVGNVKRLQQYDQIIVPVKTHEFELAQAHDTTVAALENAATATGTLGQERLRLLEVDNHITPAEEARAITLDRQATATEILRQITRKYSDALTAYNNSTAGRINNLKNLFEETMAVVGEKLLPIVNTLVGGLQNVVEWFFKNKTAALILAGAFTFLAGATGIKLVIGALRGYIMWLARGRLATLVFGGTIGAVTGFVSDFRAAMYFLNGEMAATEIVEGGLSGDTVALAGAFTALGISSGVALGIMTGGLILIPIAIFEILTHLHQVWDFIKTYWPELVGMMIGPFGVVAAYALTHLDQVKQLVSDAGHFISTEWGKLEHVLKTPWDDAEKWVKNALHNIEGAVRTGVKTVANIVAATPLGGLISAGKNLAQGNFGGAATGLLHGLTFGLANRGGLVTKHGVKHMESGGYVPTSYGPSGLDTVPAFLTPGERVLSQAENAAMFGGAGQMPNGGGQQTMQPHFTITPSPAYFRIDGRQIAEAVVRYTLERAARGPSSLIGGSLATGVSGPSYVSAGGVNL